LSAPSTSTARAARAQTASATGAAPLSQAILAQTRAELTMAWRNGERSFITVAVPVIMLFLVTALNVVPTVGKQKPIDLLLPGILSLAIMSTGMVSLGIATAYERYYGVLKRLGTSPLPRWGLIMAKVLSVLAVEVVQIVLLTGIAILFFGWRPHGSFFGTLLIVLLGTLTFASLGMLMAGALRAEATLASANGLYLLFLAIGGSIVPVDHFPAFLQPLLSILPAAALSDGLRNAMTTGLHAGSVLLLLFWSIAFLIAAALTFKWE
jgi:ABC-2 type transport system permease protein